MGKIFIEGWSRPPTKRCNPETNKKLRVEFSFRSDLKTRKLIECSLDIYYPRQLGSSMVMNAKERTDRLTYTGGGLIHLYSYEHTPACRLDISGFSTDGRCKWCINFRKMLQNEAIANRIGYEEIRCCKYGSSDKYDLRS